MVSYSAIINLTYRYPAMSPVLLLPSTTHLSRGAVPQTLAFVNSILLLEPPSKILATPLKGNLLYNMITIDCVQIAITAVQ